MADRLVLNGGRRKLTQFSKFTGRHFGFLLLPLLLIIAAGAWYLLDPGFRVGQQPTTASENLPQDAFERRVRDYLVANPQVIVEAMQNLYPPFHKAMMQVSGTADEAQVIAVAEEIGLDVEQLQTDMQDPAIDAEIERNLALARALRINGTPGFVIGDEILRGAADLQTMQRLIDQARKDQNR